MFLSYLASLKRTDGGIGSQDSSKARVIALVPIISDVIPLALAAARKAS